MTTQTHKDSATLRRAATRVGALGRWRRAAARSLAAAAAIAACSVVGTPPARADATLAAALYALMDRLTTAIDKAGTSADHVTLRAGSEAHAAVQSVQVAFARSLNTSISSITPQMREQVASLEAAAAALERRTAADSAEALRLSQQVVASLPLSTRMPQLTSWTPGAVGAGDVVLHLNGHFPQAANEGFQPVAVINGEQLGADGISSQRLTFRIPHAATGSGASKIVRIRVPYEDSVLGGTAQVKVATFLVPLAAFPRGPGQIQIRTSTPTPVREVTHIVTKQDNQQSDSDDKVEIHCGPSHSDRILHDSVKFVIDRQEGSSFTHRLERYDSPSVCEWIRTEHHRFGTSDKLWFHFEYDVESFPVRDVPAAHAIDLKWGDSAALRLAGNATFVVVLDSFDGTHSEFSGASDENRLIRISLGGDGVNVAARELADVRSPLK
jgi:hypothetical protein